MGSLFSTFMLVPLVFLLFSFHLIAVTVSFSSRQSPLCHEDESSALLEFKQSFLIKKSASNDPSAYSKVLSWRFHGNISDCCFWDGIECDEDSGHVIGLHLSSSLLYGSINSTSSLFQLVHLQSLNLADNNFNYSHIPSTIRYLSQLKSLNLSSSLFFGQIPSEIFELSHLVSLDLSNNSGLLKLEKPGLKSLVQNLTNLKILDLSMVSISSAVPYILANLSLLESLSLTSCGLFGVVPKSIFLLPNLQYLSFEDNENLTGNLPRFHPNNSLTDLCLRDTSFFGELPEAVGNLHSLNSLDLHGCSFSGFLPPSIAYLTQLTYIDFTYNHFVGEVPSLKNLSELTHLALSFNKLHLKTPKWLGMLSKLTILTLGNCSLYGPIPSSIGNLTQLRRLQLRSNNLFGEIPSWLMNLTQMRVISFSKNQFQGPVPTSISELKNLEIFSLSYNNLRGTVILDNFLKLKNLASLDFSSNELSVLIKNHTNSTLPKFESLGLGSCNLRKFPDFLLSQDELAEIELYSNKIQGLIPEWIWNVSAKTLQALDLSHNYLTGFEHSPIVLPWVQLYFLDLSFNMLQGSLPIAPKSTLLYNVNDNRLTGEIPASICSLSSLKILDLSNNKMGGLIPSCLGNFSNSLLVLNLSGNDFRGISQFFTNNGSKLRLLDLSRNQIEGKVPRSLANCKMLEILVLGNNRINDTFPWWLGAMAELQVLILRSNIFHGAIGKPGVELDFPKLRIIDLSDNGFTGTLPLEYFSNWKAMKIEKADDFAYMRTEIDIQIEDLTIFSNYTYSITIINKGQEMLYERISNIFLAIDLSRNKFEGDIPKFVGNLVGLQLINLSNNNLVGPIPSLLGNLRNLECLDLSQNKLSGEIPQQLVLLNFLEFLNLSYNQLIGRIPHGNQFNTFQNSCYKGNSGLCGDPLSKKCENSLGPAPLLPSLFSKEDKDSKFPETFDLIFIIMGYGGGLIVGLVLGNLLISRYHEWFEETFGGRCQKKRRHRRRGQRN